jgi:hypothetical protein
MSAIDQFSSLVSTLYEAAEDSRQWTRFVEEYYTAMDSTRGVLCARAPQPGMTKVFLEGYTESEKRDYSDYYFQHDEVLTAGLHSIEKSSHWMGPLEEIYPFKAMEASEIYNDYYSELGMHYASCVMVGATGPYTALGMAAFEAGLLSQLQAQHAGRGGAGPSCRAGRGIRRRDCASGKRAYRRSVAAGRGFAQPPRGPGPTW